MKQSTLSVLVFLLVVIFGLLRLLPGPANGWRCHHLCKLTPIARKCQVYTETAVADSKVYQFDKRSKILKKTSAERFTSDKKNLLTGLRGMAIIEPRVFLQRFANGSVRRPSAP
jgi:hypothetical protein